jgi:hypothetical protein
MNLVVAFVVFMIAIVLIGQIFLHLFFHGLESICLTGFGKIQPI